MAKFRRIPYEVEAERNNDGSWTVRTGTTTYHLSDHNFRETFEPVTEEARLEHDRRVKDHTKCLLPWTDEKTYTRGEDERHDSV